jgi:ubiquinone/menaquinone biosynthesis C-methylase UbiE
MLPTATHVAAVLDLPGGAPRAGVSASTLLRYLFERAAAALLLGAPVFALASATVGPRRLLKPSLLDVIARSYLRLLRQDLRNVRAGRYPAALLSVSSVWSAIARLPRLFLEYLRSVPKRRSLDTRVPALDALRPALEAALWELGVRDPEARRHAFDSLERNWPSYGLTFHWQAGGYLSRASARLYEATVEMSLAGVVDVMRRASLPPLLEALAGRTAPKVIDLTAGTGRFLHLVRTAKPGARLWANDLSPFYLCEAKALLPPETTLISGDAANVSLPDRSFDAVVVSYSLHEMPREQRAAVLREACRLVAADGVVLAYDSIQHHSADPLAGQLFSATKQLFEDLSHEPFFDAWAREPLVDEMRAAGLCVVHHEDHFVTKVVAARPDLLVGRDTDAQARTDRGATRPMPGSRRCTG